jgi:hypothetical protein
MDLFWRHGHEGRSTAQLTAAGGIAPPSRCAAFGSKDALFRDALALCGQRYGGFPSPPPVGGRRHPKVQFDALATASGRYRAAQQHFALRRPPGGGFGVGHAAGRDARGARAAVSGTA